MALLVVPHPSCCLVWFGWKSWKTSQEGEYAQNFLKDKVVRLSFGVSLHVSVVSQQRWTICIHLF